MDLWKILTLAIELKEHNTNSIIKNIDNSLFTKVISELIYSKKTFDLFFYVLQLFIIETLLIVNIYLSVFIQLHA